MAQALAARWLVSTLSKEPLREPAVACELGNLYNKEDVLRLLIDRQAFGNPYEVNHIRRMRDVVPLRMTRVSAGASTSEASFCCPITAYPLNGRYRCVARPCATAAA